jgi:hypothetical protein
VPRPWDQGERDRDYGQRELNHHIPDSLVKLTGSLTSVKYRGILAEFSDAYYDQEFPTTRDEFNMIKEYETRLVDNCVGSTMKDEIDFIMRTELGEAAAAVEERYRDHFIHPFQDFLTGILIIDKFYSEFSLWYSNALNGQIHSSVECAWLLAAIFHDKFKSRYNLSRFLVKDSRIHLEVREEANDSMHASHLSSLYDHLRGQGALETWVPSATVGTPNNLTSILKGWSAKANHAVIGAFSLLDSKLETVALAPTVHSAALAIALHDRYPRDDLISGGIFPVEPMRFPLVALLLYVDTVQEWGRGPGSKDELADVTFEGMEVRFHIHFASPSSAATKALEFSEIDKCIANSPIQWSFVSSYSIGTRAVGAAIPP